VGLSQYPFQGACLLTCYLVLAAQEAKKGMPLTGKINITPVKEDKPSPALEEPVTYASKTVRFGDPS
jgi:hypothetical protein